MRSRLSLYSTFMLRGVGFSLDELGIAGKLNMTVSTMIGVTFGGWMYMRWGTFRSLLIFGIGQALTNLLYMWLALAGKKVWLLVLATSLDTMIGGMGQAAFVAFLMSLCSADFSATQYALLSALATLPRNLSGAAAGALVPIVGWAHFFVITCLAAMPGLILLLDHAAAPERAQRARGRAKQRLGLSAASRSLQRLWTRGPIFSGAASGPASSTRWRARCPRSRGPGLPPPRRRRPTSPPVHPRRR